MKEDLIKGQFICPECGEDFEDIDELCEHHNGECI